MVSSSSSNNSTSSSPRGQMDLLESCQDHSASSLSQNEGCDDENNITQVNNNSNGNNNNGEGIERAAAAILSRQQAGDNGNDRSTTRTTSLLAQKAFRGALTNECAARRHLLVARSSEQAEPDSGNKCGKCQNHEIEISKKGHARDCPFKKCSCLKCRLLDARSDILQVISGKETKLKGTKKDPNCGFCQNHGVKILRKGHVRSCGFGQERHFKLDNCFDCEVHYIRNEVNRLQIKMRRAMKEDRMLSEEQRKTAREPITRDEVEKVCDMARVARKKRESILLSQQIGESSSQAPMQNTNHLSPSSSSSSSPSTASSTTSSAALLALNGGGQACRSVVDQLRANHGATTHTRQLDQLARQTGVWRPWSQHQVAAAMAAQQQQQHLVDPMQFAGQSHQPQQPARQQEHDQSSYHCNIKRQTGQQVDGIVAGHANQEQLSMQLANSVHQQQQLNSAITSMAVVANQTYLINSLQVVQQQRRNAFNQSQADEQIHANADSNQLISSPPSSPHSAAGFSSQLSNDQPLPLTQRNMQVQQLFTNILRLMAEQYALRSRTSNR